MGLPNFSILSVVAMFSVCGVATPAIAATSYRANHSATTVITEYACSVVNAHVSNDYLVPINTLAEWTAFASNPPSGVTITCSFSPGDGRSYTVSANGWYTDWTPPKALSANIESSGAGGGASNDGCNMYDGGSGGFSAVALVSTPTTYIAQAAGGAGGVDDCGPIHAGYNGNKATTSGTALSAVAYRIYVGKKGGDADSGNSGTSYTVGSGGTGLAGSSGDGVVTISW